jgi:hypothetical protein
MRFATISTVAAPHRELDVDKRGAKRRASVGLQKKVVRVCGPKPLTGASFVGGGARRMPA